MGTGPTHSMTRAAESTNLVGLPSRFRPSASGPMQRSITNVVGPSVLPGSSPFKRIAISAIEANNLRNQLRDVSMSAAEEKSSTMAATETQKNLEDSLANMDKETKAEVAQMQQAVALKAQDLPGAMAPLGFFDPVGFSTDCSEGKLLFYREAEIKHGRVAMLASLGILVGEQFHPLFGGNIDVPSYIAFQETPLQTFWPAVVIAIAIPEVFSVQSFNEPDSKGDKFWTVKKNYWQPGFDPLGLKPKDPKEWTDMQNKELNNGRLAMIAAAGMIAQELATGQKLF